MAFYFYQVTFLNENLGFTSVETGLIFLLVLISTLPGAMFAGIITKKTSPLGSIKIASIAFIIVNFVAFYLMADPAYKVVAWPAGATWGFMLGEYELVSSIINV
jgi:predicted MFS family arabinose efflux permease